MQDHVTFLTLNVNSNFCKVVDSTSLVEQVLIVISCRTLLVHNNLLVIFDQKVVINPSRVHRVERVNLISVV